MLKANSSLNSFPNASTKYRICMLYHLSQIYCSTPYLASPSESPFKTISYQEQQREIMIAEHLLNAYQF